MLFDLIDLHSKHPKDLNISESICPKPIEKITSIVNSTGIPKETVRRKIKSVIKRGFLLKKDDVRGYVWNFHENSG